MLEGILLAVKMEVVTEFWERHKPPPTPIHWSCENEIHCNKMAKSIYNTIDKKKYKKIRILICYPVTSKNCDVIYDETYS